jgi:ribose/xylose/arabinose/galactoside ABC-type transport system permease subunit
MRELLLNILRRKEIVVIIITIILLLILSIGASSTFLTQVTFESLQASIAPNAIVAVGMVILLISGVFDLSVGSVMGLSGAMTALMLTQGAPAMVGILVGLGIGLAFGLFNGFLVAYGKVNPLIVTIGTLFIGRGLVNAVMRGELRYGIKVNNASFLVLGQGKSLGMYNMFWIMLVVVVLAQFITLKTDQGRKLYFIGSNNEAARLVGIKVKRTRLFTFMLSGFLAALAGVLATSRFGISSLYLGLNLELKVIIGCLLGGASIAGGQGLVAGSFLGVVFLALVVTVFNILEVNPYWQNIIVGAILVFIVSLDAYLVTKRKKALGEI